MRSLCMWPDVYDSEISVKNGFMEYLVPVIDLAGFYPVQQWLEILVHN